jgi:CheY-like chemotaxis protein
VVVHDEDPLRVHGTVLPFREPKRNRKPAHLRRAVAGLEDFRVRDAVMSVVLGRLKAAPMMMHDTSSDPHVLIVEDQPLDAMLLRRAIARLMPAVLFEALHDGSAALRRLREPEAPVPDLIVLDLNLPGPSGHELLAEARSTEHLGATPCVVLTSSKTEQDRRRSLELGATDHMIKPSSLDDYSQLASALVRLLGSAARVS